MAHKIAKAVAVAAKWDETEEGKQARATFLAAGFTFGCILLVFMI